MSRAATQVPQVDTSTRPLQNPESAVSARDSPLSPSTSARLPVEIHRRSLSAKLGFRDEARYQSYRTAGASSIPRHRKQPKHSVANVADVNANRSARGDRLSSETGSGSTRKADNDVNPDTQSEFPGRRALSRTPPLKTERGKSSQPATIRRQMTVETTRSPATLAVATTSKYSSRVGRQSDHQQEVPGATSLPRTLVPAEVSNTPAAVHDDVRFAGAWVIPFATSVFSNAQVQRPQHPGTPSSPEVAERSRSTVAQVEPPLSPEPHASPILSLPVVDERNPSRTSGRVGRVTLLQAWMLGIVAVGTLSMPLGMFLLSYLSTPESDISTLPAPPPTSTPGSRTVPYTLTAQPTSNTADPWTRLPVSCTQGPLLDDNALSVSPQHSPQIAARRRYNFFCLYNNSRFLRGMNFDFLPANLPFGYCTHVVYWSFGVSNGVPFSRTPQFDKKYGLHTLRHTVNHSMAPDVKIVLAIGGYSSDQPQFLLLGRDGGALSRFVRDTMQLLRLHSLDGIAIHWREPKPGCPSPRGGDVTSALHSLLSAMRRSFQLNGFPGLLSIIMSTEVSTASEIVDSVVDVVDYVFLDVRQLRPRTPTYNMCGPLAHEVRKRIENASVAYRGNEPKFCPVLSVAPWLVEVVYHTFNTSTPVLTGLSAASELGGEPGFGSLLKMCSASSGSAPCDVDATPPNDSDACFAVAGSASPMHRPLVRMFHSRFTWRKIFYGGLPVNHTPRCALLNDLDMDNYADQCRLVFDNYWLLQYLRESLAGSASGFVAPEGVAAERQEPAAGGSLSALLPVTPSTILEDVEIAPGSPPAENDQAKQQKPSGMPVSEGRVAAPQLRDIGARKICVTPSGTPQEVSSPGTLSPDTRGNFSAALHALYTTGSTDEDYRKTSVSGLCCLLVVLPAVAIAVVCLLSYLKARSVPATDEVKISPLAELTEACPGTFADWPVSGCHEVMSSVLEASNPHVAPCDDFYEHVCGWWSRWKDNHITSQVKELVRAFNNRVMSTLLNVTRDLGASHRAPRTVWDQMALFYSSCFTMAVTSGHLAGSAGNVVAALGMSVETWLGSPTFGSLLELVVSASLKTGLPSIIALSFKDKTYRVDVGKTLASTLAKYGQVDANVVHDLIRDLNGTRRSSQTTANTSTVILKLDSEMEQIRRHGAGKQSWFMYVSLDQMRALTAFDVNWTRALERGLPVWLRNAKTMGGRLFQVRAAGTIVRLVDRLRPEPLQLVGLYALVVLISQVMKHKASMKQPLVLFSSADRMLWCLRQTATHFSAVYPAWVAANFQDKEGADKLRAIFDQVVATLNRDNRVNAGVVVLTRRLKRARLVLLGDTAGDGALPTVKIPVSLGDMFLPNLAQLITSRVGRIDDVAMRKSMLQLRGHFGFDRDDFVVATAFVHRATIYSRFAREDTRYATLAVRLLRKLFESESDYDPPGSANYVNHCFADSVASTLGRSPVGASSTTGSDQGGGADVKPFMGSRWSVQLAWRMAYSSSFRQSGVAKNSSKFARLFFRLAFFARCGEPLARDECNDFAKFAPELAAAYDCPGKRKGVCEECATARRCETHLPLTI
ncbi:hypothetical protein HPB52_000840 [Rhipicephalus sanguineus]|uniref:GH18 domain-containing protein n=1 Tax=Rhipicephalus sanguineus TaxID=34632 RepID=A0A9D4SPW0_RHISA|nr:hypothetical protein HPB52_000840 [Rhipicephalus sanguineus]